MMRFVAALALVMVPAVGGAGEWLSSYSKAYETAKQANKPMFIYFTDSSQNPDWKNAFEGMDSLTDAYVLVVADKAGSEGPELYKTFENNGEHGSVVIDRTQKWQYFRTTKKLDTADLKTVLDECKEASGKPTSNVLQAVSQTSTESIQTFRATGDCPNCRRFR